MCGMGCVRYGLVDGIKWDEIIWYAQRLKNSSYHKEKIKRKTEERNEN